MAVITLLSQYVVVAHQPLRKSQKTPICRMLARAATRALRDPDRYMMTITPDIGAARLAIGMLGHPAHVLEALNAMGWGDGIDPPK